MKHKRKMRIKRRKHLKQLRREAENKGVSVRQIHVDTFNNNMWR